MQKTNFPFIAIVHDDASTDATASIIREYELKYPEIIKPIYEKENLYHRKDGSLRKIMYDSIPKGVKYVAFCEGDDYWTDPYKLQKQVDFLDTHEDVGLCYTDCDIYDEDTRKIKKNIFKQSKCFGYCNLFEDAPGYMGNVSWVFRKNIYDNDKYKYCHSTDEPLLLLYNIMSSSKTYGIEDNTAVWRIHDGSISNNQDSRKGLEYEAGIVHDLLLYENQCKKDLSLLLLKKCYEVLRKAYLYQEDAIIQEMKSFFEAKGLDLMMRDMKNYNEIKNFFSYKLGNIIAEPYRLFKRLLSMRKK
jgi:glycosyltransferase involved in cell wall biosynthesis